MDLNDTAEQAAYRDEVRAWLEANKADRLRAPARPRTPTTSTPAAPGSASWPRTGWPA